MFFFLTFCCAHFKKKIGKIKWFLRFFWKSFVKITQKSVFWTFGGQEMVKIDFWWFPQKIIFFDFFVSENWFFIIFHDFFWFFHNSSSFFIFHDLSMTRHWHIHQFTDIFNSKKQGNWNPVFACCGIKKI